MTLTPSPSVAVTATLVLAGSKQKLAPGPTVKAPVASVCQSGSVSIKSWPLGEYTRLSVSVLFGVKPVTEIVPAAWSREMSAVETGTSCPPLSTSSV